MITVILENQDQGDLFVSVTDLNQADAPEILKKERINRGETRLLDIQEDGNDTGRIRWLAQRTDHPQKAAQHVATPGSGDTVEITTFFD
jgi:hypothetical protein